MWSHQIWFKTQRSVATFSRTFLKKQKINKKTNNASNKEKWKGATVYSIDKYYALRNALQNSSVRVGGGEWAQAILCNTGFLKKKKKTLEKTLFLRLNDKLKVYLRWLAFWRMFCQFLMLLFILQFDPESADTSVLSVTIMRRKIKHETLPAHGDQSADCPIGNAPCLICHCTFF